jgi:hypothetical protein
VEIVFSCAFLKYKIEGVRWEAHRPAWSPPPSSRGLSCLGSASSIVAVLSVRELLKMASNGIPMDKAELLSVLLEAILYGKLYLSANRMRKLIDSSMGQGFSLLMFGITIWVLWFRRIGHQVNYRMLTAACALLVLSTTVRTFALLVRKY